MGDDEERRRVRIEFYSRERERIERECVFHFKKNKRVRALYKR